jgi:hypothetical protein
MTRHLAACRGDGEAASGETRAPRLDYHIVVETPYGKDYWLHVAAPVDAPLSALDSFLRRIWLECCGHMSCFSIGPLRYASSPMRELDERGMRVALNRVLEVGTALGYEYDYGSTTELRLRVVGLREHRKAGKQVVLLARNDPPEIGCGNCGQAATHVCGGCSESGDGWLCDGCARKHECGEDMLLPLVNSPRTGVCAYSG